MRLILNNLRVIHNLKIVLFYTHILHNKLTWLLWRNFLF